MVVPGLCPFPADDVGAIKAFKEKSLRKVKASSRKGTDDNGQAKIFTDRFPQMPESTYPAPKLTNEAEVIESKFAPDPMFKPLRLLECHGEGARIRCI